MKLKNLVFCFSLTVTAILSVAITFTLFPAFSGFAAGLAKAAIGIIIFYVIDAVVLSEVDTIHELITRKNKAYAIFILSYSIILAATIATA